MEREGCCEIINKEECNVNTGPFTGNWVFDMWITAYEVFKMEHCIDDCKLKALYPYIIIALYGPYKEDREEVLNKVLNCPDETCAEKIVRNLEFEKNNKGKIKALTNHKGFFKNFWVFNKTFESVSEIITLLKEYRDGNKSLPEFVGKDFKPNTIWKMYPSPGTIPFGSYSQAEEFIPDGLWKRDDVRLGLLLYPRYAFVEYRGNTFFYYPNKSYTANLICKLRNQIKMKQKQGENIDIYGEVIRQTEQYSQQLRRSLENVLSELYIIKLGSVGNDQKFKDVKYFITDKKRAKVLLSTYGDKPLYTYLNTSVKVHEGEGGYKNLLELFMDGYELLPYIKRYVYESKMKTYLPTVYWALLADLKLHDVKFSCPTLVFEDRETQYKLLRFVLSHDREVSVNTLLRNIYSGKVVVLDKEKLPELISYLYSNDRFWRHILSLCIARGNIKGGEKREHGENA